MKVSEAIRYLSEYEDQEREILISWNDSDHLEEGDPRVWEEAVIYFEKWGGAEFNAECREAISIARERIEEEGEQPCWECGYYESDADSVPLQNCLTCGRVKE